MEIKRYFIVKIKTCSEVDFSRYDIHRDGLPFVRELCNLGVSLTSFLL